MVLTNGQQPLYACANHQPNYGGLVDTSDPEELLNNEDWVLTGGMSLVGGEVICDDAQEFGTLSQPIAPPYADTVCEFPFVVTITIDSITQGAVFVDGADSYSTPGTHIATMSALSTPWGINSSGFCDAVISQLSLKRIYDEDLGPELIANGAFASGASWTPQAGWTIAGGVAVCNNEGDDTLLTNTAEVEDGSIYKCSFTVSGADPGSGPQLYISDSSTNPIDSNAPIIEDDGAYEMVLRSSVSEDVAVYGSGILNIDNLSLKKYTLPS